MSTFNGVVEEFPSIRIDYFRKIADRPAPLVCFLSHVHSDHLQGLESLRSPFIYCSAVTREILLRIEKYPHRMNFAKGILESRKQHYGHLAKLLRPIPLNTPTDIELTPRQRIRVTLLDANHCAGAVMFLIEGDGKSILYTGDIRAESWWVNALARHPVLIPYAAGLQTLDTLYLDTTFAIKSNIYGAFPSKADGIKELLEKVRRYPEDTIFYLRAWTFGYEDVWQALSAALMSKVHVDRYQFGLYRSLIPRSPGITGLDDVAFLGGFRLGNEFVPGCLTSDESARIHSCEPGVFCSTMKCKRSVFITPVVTRTRDGSEVPELGAGGGKGDLYQSHELELPDETTIQKLELFCLEQIQDPQLLSRAKTVLKDAYASRRALQLNEYGSISESDISLKDFISMISRATTNCHPSALETLGYCQLPDTITFPYSRHSSYMELCELVSAFKPKDVYPCTVDTDTWDETVSMESLFGHLCSGERFAHDTYMRGLDEIRDERRAKRARYSMMREVRDRLQQMGGDPAPFAIGPLPADMNTMLGQHFSDSPEEKNDLQRTTIQGPFPSIETASVSVDGHQAIINDDDDDDDSSSRGTIVPVPESQNSVPESLFEESQTPVYVYEAENTTGAGLINPGHTHLRNPSSADEPSSSATVSDAVENRRRAYRAARAGTFEAWSEVSLLSAGNNHTEEEMEL